MSVRAHVASLVAVFLALALGVLIGGEVLHTTVVQGLRTQVAAAEATATGAVAAGEADRAAREQAESFTTSAAPRLVSGRLPGRQVLLVSLAGTTTDDRNRLAATLQAAGATLAGDLRLAGLATDPDAGELLSDVAARLKPEGLIAAGTGGQRFAEVLAAGSAGGEGPQADAARVVPALRGAGLLERGSRSDSRSDAVVLLAPAGEVRGSQSTLLLALARAYSARGASVVVTGPATSAAAGGALAALRADALRSTVSSADGLETAEGPIVATLALAERVTGRTGHYGRGPGAAAPLPPA